MWIFFVCLSALPVKHMYVNTKIVFFKTLFADSLELWTYLSVTTGNVQYKLISKYFLFTSLFICIWTGDAKAQNTVRLKYLCAKKINIVFTMSMVLPNGCIYKEGSNDNDKFRRKAHWNKSLLIIRPSYLVFETLHDRISKAVCTKIIMSKLSNTRRNKLNEWKLKWD